MQNFCCKLLPLRPNYDSTNTLDHRRIAQILLKLDDFLDFVHFLLQYIFYQSWCYTIFNAKNFQNFAFVIVQYMIMANFPDHLSYTFFLSTVWSPAIIHLQKQEYLHCDKNTDYYCFFCEIYGGSAAYILLLNVIKKTRQIITKCHFPVCASTRNSPFSGVFCNVF